MTTHAPSARRRGSVLIVAMVILFALAAMTLAMTHAARIDAGASANRAATLEAAAIARGAEAWVVQIAAADGPAVMQRSESEFERRPLGNGYFWIVRPDYGDPTLPRFGLTDEAGKLTLNPNDDDPLDAAQLGRALRALPEMTDEIADAILDWTDANDDTANGAESQYYLALDPPYHAKNQPVEFVEELLLVRGVTREWLYGNPALSFDGAPGFSSMSHSPWALEHGVFDYLTAYSVDPGLSNDAGEANYDITESGNRDLLLQRLPGRLPSNSPVTNAITNALQQQSPQDIFELAQLAAIDSEDLRLIEDLIRSTPVGHRGLININTAPREVLLCIEQLTEDQVDRLLAARPNAVAANPNTMAWVRDVLTQNQANGLGNFITARSYQFSADIVAVSGNGRGFRRERVVVDVAGATPRVIYRRDITHRGWPLEPEVLGELRRGGVFADGQTGGAL